MEVKYLPTALSDITYWKQSGNTQIQRKIQALIADVELHPYWGIGKPEPLKYEYEGFWSRRINREHRLIYSVSDMIYIHSLRGHYL